MGDSQPSPSNLHQITNRPTHDTAISAAQGQPPNYDNGTPTLIYISSSSSPACKAAYPRVIALAESNPHVQIYVMELTAETAPMIKFGPQNCPIFILMVGMWCETVLGPDFKRVDGLIETKFKKDETGRERS